MPTKIRLDSLLLRRGLFDSRSKAAASIMAGEVRLGLEGSPAQKPGMLVRDDAEVAVAERPRYVSRGGDKLAHALARFPVGPEGRHALDVGASAGGFTDCLLRAGAARVVALDVGYGQLDWAIRNHERVTVLERRNARSLRPEDLPYRPDLIVVDVSFIGLTKVLPAVVACAASRFDLLALVKPQFELGRERVGQGGVVRSADDRLEALVSVGDAAIALGLGVRGFCASGVPGPAGNRESFIWCSEAARGSVPDVRAAAEEAEPRALSRGPGDRGPGDRGPGVSVAKQPATARPVRSATVYTHRTPEETSDVLRQLMETAERAGVELRFDADETVKHGLTAGEQGAVKPNAEPEGADLCIVLGGDGTTLRALRRYAGGNTPVFSVNCGRIGFLASIERDEIVTGLERALSGDFEVLKLPALLFGDGDDREYALNEVSFQRGSHTNVAHLAYSVADERVARAPCDGLIAATPAGSTGYNLSAGGPILAWGVRAFVITLVAPHALGARSLVAAPADVLRVTNEGNEPVDVVVDGMRTGEIGPGEGAEVRFRPDAAALAQLPGASFYGRFREKLRLLTS